MNQSLRRGFCSDPVPLLFCLKRCVILLVPIIASTVAVGADVSIVRKAADTVQPVNIVGQSKSADGKSATVTLQAPYGIFALDVDLGKNHFERLTFVIKGAKTWEGVTFTPLAENAKVPTKNDSTRSETVELKESPGVTINARKSDCVIEFGPEAIKILKRGGKFQFVDAYRS